MCFLCILAIILVCSLFCFTVKSFRGNLVPSKPTMEVESPTACEFVLYENDGLVVTYTDGSHLELSPCASSFIHVQPSSYNAHPLQGLQKVQQQTEFVTSQFRDLVAEALEFRNLMAERPCLMPNLVKPQSIIRKHGDFLGITWPRSPHTCHIDELADGSCRLASLDGQCHVTLAPCRQFLSVQYLAPLHSDSFKSSPNIKLGDGDMKDEEADGLQCWVVQHHSVLHPPPYLTHPLALLIQLPIQDDNTEHSHSHGMLRPEGNVTDEEKLVAEAGGGVADDRFVLTRMPEPLSTRCQQRHLHKFRVLQKEEGKERGRMKAVCVNGVIYRLWWEEPRGVEVHPGDGSLLRSKHISAHYFQHYIYSQRQVEERLYSVKNLPPTNPNLTYSLSALVTTATRLMDHLCSEHLQLTSHREASCWKPAMTSMTSLPSATLLEETVVAGLGRFSAFTSGRVRVVFTDRTCLETQADFSSRVQHCQQHSPNASDSGLSSLAGVLSCMPPGICRAILPDGSQVQFLVDQPGQYFKYSEAVQQWIDWVNTPPDKRDQFYKGTRYDPQCQAEVSSELTRIKCLNYLVDEKVIPQVTSQPQLLPVIPGLHDNTQSLPTASHLASGTAGSQREVDLVSVMHALRSTSKHLADLDKFMNSVRSQQPE